MKFILSTFLIFAIFSAFAETEIKLASPESQKNFNDSVRDANKEYANKTTFLYSYKNWYKEESSKEFNDMIAKISSELADEFALTGSPLQGRSCEKKCYEYGQSEIRKTFGTSSLSSEADKCIRLCRTYFREYHGYMSGLFDAREKMLADKALSKASSDCNGTVNTSSRKSKPSLERSMEEIAKQVKTKER